MIAATQPEHDLIAKSQPILDFGCEQPDEL